LLTLLQPHEALFVETNSNAIANEESRPRSLHNRLLLVALTQHRHVILVVMTAWSWHDVLQVDVAFVA